MKEIRKEVALYTGATEEDQAIRTSSGNNLYGGRVNWAKTYLVKAGLITNEGFNKHRITPRGVEALESGQAVDLDYLSRFPEFRRFVKDDRDGTNEGEPNISVPECNRTPEDVLESSIRSINEELEDALLENISAMTDASFEALVVDLLGRIYGGDFEKNAEVTGGTGDEGIDGIVKQDRLGFNNIYIQAKKWKGNVGRPEIQKFAGALQGQNATYGAFITSSGFSKDAIGYAEKVSQSSHIVLIGGRELVKLMIEYDVGVVTRRTIQIKGVDSSYFE